MRRKVKSLNGANAVVDAQWKRPRPQKTTPHYLHVFHAQLHSFSWDVYFGNFYGYLLAEFDYVVGIFDEFIGNLGDVYQAILLYANVYKRTKIGDVGDDAWQYQPNI